MAQFSQLVDDSLGSGGRCVSLLRILIGHTRPPTWQILPWGLASVEEVGEDWDLGMRAASREFSPNAPTGSHPYLLGSIRFQESRRAAAM